MKKAVFFVLIIFSLSLVSCVNFISDYQDGIYDNEKKILAQGDSYSYYMRDAEYLSESGITQSFDSFSGIDTMIIIDATGDATMQISYNADIDDGDFKIVLIKDGVDKITTLSEGDVDDSTTVDITEGKYRLKIVGREAEGDVTLFVDIDGNATIEQMVNNY